MATGGTPTMRNDRERMERDPAKVGAGLDTVTPWTTTLPSRTRVADAGEVESSVLKLPAHSRVAAKWRSMVRETASAFKVQPASRFSWVPLVALALTALLAIAGFARSFWVTEGRTGSEADQLLKAAQEIRDGMVTMRGELMGEVSAIRGTVTAQQRQLDKLDADVHAQLEQKDKDITRLESQVREAMAYAQSADKNIARLQERVAKNGG